MMRNPQVSELGLLPVWLWGRCHRAKRGAGTKLPKGRLSVGKERSILALEHNGREGNS